MRTWVESAETWAPWTPSGPVGLDPDERFLRERRRATIGGRSGTHLRLGAFAHDGTLVGLFSLNEIVQGVFQSAYASWQVRAGRTGEGFATEAVRGLLGVAFTPEPEGLGLHRVQANVMPANAASLRVADKIGFRREGIAVAYLRIAGEWEDHVMHAITREEWRGAGSG